MMSPNPLPVALTPADHRCLQRAHEHLEYPGLAIRLSNVIGTPIEMGFKLLPRRWYRRLRHAAERAIWQALDLAVLGLERHHGTGSQLRYQLAGCASGAIGGFFGGPALLLELPVTTLIMLRAIADIARSEGEDLGQLEVRLACLQVFALGGHSADDDAAETGYYGLRLALEAPIQSASRHLAQYGLADRAKAPMLVNLIAKVSERFGIRLSEKAAAEAVPIVGALAGAAVNCLFIQHFQNIARSHFTVRRLERKYGARLVRQHYERISRPLAPISTYPLAA